MLIEGETLADTRRPWLVFEAGLPTRYYLPLEDVRMALLTPSETRTLCVYKGEALYWSAMVGNEVYEDVAWRYPDPVPANPQIRDLICFFNEQVDIEVDGEWLERPTTQWSEASARTAGWRQRQRARTARAQVSAAGRLRD